MTEVENALTIVIGVFPGIKQIRGDNQFDSSVIRDFCDSRDIILKLTASHNSRQNPVERCHRTIRELMEKLSGEQGIITENWEDVLYKACQHINFTPNLVTKFSPYRILYNKLFPVGDGDDYINDELSLGELRSLVYERSESVKDSYVTDKVLVTLEPGTRVKVQYDSKLEPFFAEVVRDYGLTVLINRETIGCRFKEIRVAKRHIVVVNNKD